MQRRRSFRCAGHRPLCCAHTFEKTLTSFSLQCRKMIRKRDGYGSTQMKNAGDPDGVADGRRNCDVAVSRMQTLMELLNREQPSIADQEDPWLFVSPDDQLRTAEQ